ncbi:MAG: YbhB/YbcL family Raf kinase inhibitor-like protein [Acidimicrobiia bacterium]|nr:YbhB/YbcL family Raf kinase inhibitor-like protein [Acidimicrobiia bacterium]
MNRSMNRSMIGPALAALVVLLAACDTGDGKTLKDTVVPTTIPPPDTTPLDSVALDSVAIDGELDGAIGVVPDSSAETSALPVVPTEVATGPMEVIGPWQDGAPIDQLYTCDGEDISPPLSWQAVPDAAVELALVVFDDDSGTPTDPAVLWVLAGFNPELISLTEGEVPASAIEATNSAGEVGWTGPCPSTGSGSHDYRFKLHALAQQVELGDGVPVSEVLPYLEDLTIAAAELIGTYER